MSWEETLTPTVSATEEDGDQAGGFEEDDELDLDDGEEFSDEDFEDDDDDEDSDEEGEDDDAYAEWEEEFEYDEPERHHRPEWH